MPADAACGLHLPRETGAELRPPGVLTADQLDRDRAATDGPSEVHLAHAAVAETAQQAITPDLARVTGL
jgi:hypothetical protein